MRFKNILPIPKTKSGQGLGAMLLLLLLVGVGLFAFRVGSDADEQESKLASSEGSKVIVEEYLSLTCPHCAVFHREVYLHLAKGVLQNEHVVFVYRDFPLDRLALQAAVLARCGGEGLRAKLIGAMLERQHKWMNNEKPQEALFAIVALAGIDRARAQACLEDEALERAVLEEQIAGRKRYKISSTPTIVVAGKKLSGNLEEKSVARAIEESLRDQGF